MLMLRDREQGNGKQKRTAHAAMKHLDAALSRILVHKNNF